MPDEEAAAIAAGPGHRCDKPELLGGRDRGGFFIWHNLRACLIDEIGRYCLSSIFRDSALGQPPGELANLPHGRRRQPGRRRSRDGPLLSLAGG